MSEKTRQELMRELAAPFGPDEIKCKPAVVSGNRALALFYVDARLVMDRLDDVFGIGSWQATYRNASEGVVCSLSVRVAGEWIVHEDFGGFSEQPDDGDKYKAAFSDALKRAAVHLGIGRYLYRLPQLWADYDPQKRQFVKKPTLPDRTVKDAVHTHPEPAPAGEKKEKEKPAQLPPAAQQPARAEEKPAAKMPADGKELLARLTAYDKLKASEGLWREGDLLRAVVAAGVRAGHEPDLTAWKGAGLEFAIAETRKYEAACKVAQAKKLLGDLVLQGVPGEVALAEVTATKAEDLDEPRLAKLREKLAHLQAGTMTKEQAFPGIVAKAGGKRTSKKEPLASREQQARLDELVEACDFGPGFIAAALRAYGAKTAAELTETHAGELIGKWEDKEGELMAAEAEVASN